MSSNRVLSTWKQVELYKDYQKKLRGHVGEKKANYIISEALYVISMGTNDFLSNYYLNPIVQARYSIDQYQNFIIGIIENLLRELHNLGARKIAVVGLPPMGCLPLERSTNIFRLKGDTCVEKYNMVAMSFNSQLNTLLQKLNKEVPGIRLVYANSYDLLWDYIHDPAKYGFENTGRACCATGRFELSFLCNELDPTTCQDASKFVFWDSFHPTEKTNRLIAETLAKTGLKQFF
ncbi:GDSL esterase/lipase At4g26790-like [Cornus florida]|uniref:GDSL esterase/lipase At4g26790-like n=1 Tax=Cornus florida TaxID=4283 RepID=UPI00289F0F40|nr:GDSL esterase/lipase At4g26790-like [Cornus florida]